MTIYDAAKKCFIDESEFDCQDIRDGKEFYAEIRRPCWVEGSYFRIRIGVWYNLRIGEYEIQIPEKVILAHDGMEDEMETSVFDMFDDFEPVNSAAR